MQKQAGLIGVVLLLALLPLPAGAQSGCTVRVEAGRIVVAGCVVVTATPARTATATRTPTPTATVTPTATATAMETPQPARHALGPEWGGDVGGYYSDGQRLRVAGGGAIFWLEQFGAAQEAFVTLAQIDRTSTGLALLLLSEAAGSPHPSVLAVRYDPRSGTLQPLHTLAGGWHSLGAPVAAAFAPGDQFGARYADGVLTAWRNGVEVARWRVEPAWFAPPPAGYTGLMTDAAPGWALDDFGGGTLP
jgi:hypothetical protein